MNYNQPNTRERIAARRQAMRGSRRPGRPGSGAAARPGAARSLAGWLISGRALSLALCLVSLASLGYLLTAGSFTIGRVEVQGNSALSAEIVAELSALRGAPIWFVDGAGAVARLKQNPYIEEARVSVELPDIARISLVERRPDVRWQVGGLQYLVDSGGQVLAAADEPPTEDVLVINASGEALRPGDHIDLDALQLARMLALRLPTEVALAPAVIGWDYGLGVYVKTAAGQTIVFGRNEQMDRKLIVLNHLLNNEPTAFTYLDLRPANPFYQNNDTQPSALP